MPVGTYGTVKAMAPDELVDARRADRARQHLPPVAAARARGHRGARRPAPLHGLGRGRSSPTRAASRSSASAPLRKVSEEGVTLRLAGQRRPAAADARRCRWQVQRTLDSDIVMVFDECTPYPATHGRRRARRWSCRCAGPRRSRARLRRARQPQRAVRHRPGRHARGPARRLAAPACRRSASTATRSAGCRWASPRTRCCACSTTRRRGCRRTGRAT